MNHDKYYKKISYSEGVARLYQTDDDIISKFASIYNDIDPEAPIKNAQHYAREYREAMQLFSGSNLTTSHNLEDYIQRMTAAAKAFLGQQRVENLLSDFLFTPAQIKKIEEICSQDDHYTCEIQWSQGVNTKETKFHNKNFDFEGTMINELVIKRSSTWTRKSNYLQTRFYIKDSSDDWYLVSSSGLQKFDYYSLNKKLTEGGFYLCDSFKGLRVWLQDELDKFKQISLDDTQPIV